MEGSTRYVNHSCRPSCLQVGSGEPCIPLGKAVFSETPDSMFVVTHTQVQNKQGQQHYFASSAEATIIRIEYTVGIPQVPWYQSRPSAYDWHTSQNIETSAVDENGEVWRHFGPGAAISLSLAELLHLAGFDSLDDINSLTGANFAPSATDAMAAGPMFRLSGMQIGINMDCGLRSTDTDQRKCIMSVSSTPHSWVSSASASTDGTIHANHGVRVRLHITGREYSFDVHSAFLNIASMLVYFKLPETIVFLVALYFCGHVSDVYRHIVYRRFSLAKEAGAMAMRLLEHEITFSELETLDDQHAGLGYIDKASIACSLEHILSRRTHTLDNTEMRQMVDFCVSKVSHKFKGATQKFVSENRAQAFFSEICESLNTICQDLREAFGFAHIKTDHASERVDVDKFASACSSLEMISFSDLVKLFDKDRNMSVLESLFMPLEFKACVLEQCSAEDFEERVRHSKRQSSHALEKKVLGMLHNVETLAIQLEMYERSHQKLLDDIRTLQTQLSGQQEETHVSQAILTGLREHVSFPGSANFNNLRCPDSDSGVTVVQKIPAFQQPVWNTDTAQGMLSF